MKSSNFVLFVYSFHCLWTNFIIATVSKCKFAIIVIHCNHCNANWFVRNLSIINSCYLVTQKFLLYLQRAKLKFIQSCQRVWLPDLHIFKICLKIWFEISLVTILQLNCKLKLSHLLNGIICSRHAVYLIDRPLQILLMLLSKLYFIHYVLVT